MTHDFDPMNRELNSDLGYLMTHLEAGGHVFGNNPTEEHRAECDVIQDQIRAWVVAYGDQRVKAVRDAVSSDLTVLLHVVQLSGRTALDPTVVRDCALNAIDRLTTDSTPAVAGPTLPPRWTHCPQPYAKWFYVWTPEDRDARAVEIWLNDDGEWNVTGGPIETVPVADLAGIFTHLASRAERGPDAGGER